MLSFRSIYEVGAVHKNEALRRGIDYDNQHDKVFHFSKVLGQIRSLLVRYNHGRKRVLLRHGKILFLALKPPDDHELSS